MTRPHIVYYAAASLDGYIARSDGNVDWLEGVDNEGSGEYEEFYNGIDALVMGRTTYEQVLGFGAWPYEGKACHVFSHSLTGGAFAEITNERPALFVKWLAEKNVKKIWLVGGSRLAGAFLADGCIDELVLTTVPVVLGAGIPLFTCSGIDVVWQLRETRRMGDCVQSSYTILEKRDVESGV